jgi:hypothetical protein
MDGMTFFDAYEGEQQRLLLSLHRLLSSLPDVHMKIRYQIPFYYRRSWICYLNPQKKGSVELAFTRGNELEDPGGLLEARGRAQVQGILLPSLRSFDPEALLPLLYEAIALDEALPYAPKRQPRRGMAAE